MLHLGSRFVISLLALLLVIPAALPVATADSAKRKRFKTVTRTFTQAGDVMIPNGDTSPVVADPFPSALRVGGFKKGRIKDVNLTLREFSHELPDNVDILLVKGEDNATAALVMSDIGGTAAATGLTLTLDDEAAAGLPTDGPLGSGTFRPTNSDDLTDNFPEPAPALRGDTALAAFDGITPNGAWRLFVTDDFGLLFTGGIGSWELEITARVRSKNQNQSQNQKKR